MTLKISLIQRYCYLLVIFSLAFILVNCQGVVPNTTSPSWKPDDVRMIDPVDSSSPDKELLAFYTRTLQGIHQIRLDFLELSDFPEFDLIITIDHSPAGGNLFFPGLSTPDSWDAILSISSDGNIKIKWFNNQIQEWLESEGLSSLVLRDPVLDTIDITLDRDLFKGITPKTRIMALITDPQTQEIFDYTTVVSWEGMPVQRLPVLLAFSNTFPAFIPSQGLRRWDGAHTGPQGGRHGLSNLLRVSRNHQAHILLLDTINSQSISALNYQQGLQEVNKNYMAQLLTLANPLPASSQDLPIWMVEHFLTKNQEAANNVGIPPIRITYEPITFQKNTSTSLFSSFSTWSNPVFVHESFVEKNSKGLQILLPAFPAPGEPDQITPSGISLPWKEFLARAAWDLNYTNKILIPVSNVVMGGSLPQSSWGHPASARAAFRYIKTHPWLKITGKYDIQAGSHLVLPEWISNSHREKVENQFTNTEPPWLMEALKSSPGNQLGQAAWDTYLSFFSPVFPLPEELPELRRLYTGEVGKLLEAARWAEKPIAQSSCYIDPDHDGQEECLISSETTFAIFELEGGYLSNLVISCAGTVHQLVGSSAQIITGLSDPSDWDLDNPDYADPQVMPGAFVGPPGQYSWSITKDQVTLTSPEYSIKKVFNFAPGVLRVEISNENFFTQSRPNTLPLLVDPWERFSTRGLKAYRSVRHQEEDNWNLAWGVDGELQVRISASEHLRLTTFKDSQKDLYRPENPNFEYPPGHFLPYSLAVLEWEPQQAITLELSYPCQP